MEQLGSEQARKQLPELLEKARRGEVTLITKHGKPYAALVPLSALTRGSADVLALRGSGRKLWGAEPGREIAELREEWE